MSAVTVGDEGPLTLLPEFGEWTVDDLEKLPDDGRQYELFDGVLVVSPAPWARHQRALGAIYRMLYAACPPELEVFVAPLDFQPTDRRSFQPDVLVVRRADVQDDAPLRRPLVLAVEVLSDSTRSKDRIFKREMYATSQVPLFWIFDPKRLEFTAFELCGETYEQAVHARGEERITVERPYPVVICPAEIAKG
jgi:Uma2 family endonuclease